MTDIIKFEAAPLTASVSERTFSAKLLPYGEVGRTNVGQVTAARGSVRLPRDPNSVVGRLGHDDPDQPAASIATELEETDDGLMLAGRVLNGDEGDALLAEIVAGTRNMVSVEVAKPIIHDGRLVGGQLYAYAHVPEGAFPSARLVAADHGDYESAQLIDKLTAESIKYRQRAKAAEAEVERLKADAGPMMLMGPSKTPATVTDINTYVEWLSDDSGNTPDQIVVSRDNLLAWLRPLAASRDAVAGLRAELAAAFR